MPITLTADGIEGLAAGGFGDNIVTAANMYTGAVLQTVETVKTDVFSGGGASTTYYAITGFTATITPSSASNKVLILANMQLGSGYWEIQGKLTRDGSDVTGSLGTARGSRLPCSFAVNHYFGGVQGYDFFDTNYCYLDSPATTSAVTYGISINGYSTYAVYMNRTGYDLDSADYYGCPVSTLTLMEIKA
jgi:hypothetical protein